MQIKDSMECAKSELDLFSVPPTNTAIEDAHWDNIQPHPNFDQSPVVRYDITGTNSHYLDLSATELHVTFKIITSRGVSPNVAPHEKVALTNNFLHSMFEQCQVFLNNVPVENTNKCYAYRAYLENLLCYSKEAKQNLLRGDFFFHEDKKVTEWAAKGGENKLVDATEQYAIEAKKGTPAVNQPSKTYEAYGKIHCDIFNIAKYLLNNIDVKVVLTRAADRFCLLSDGVEAFVSIENTFLRIRRVKISNAVMLAHAMALEQTTAKYPIKRVLVKPFVIPTNSSMFTISGIHFGIMPTRVVMGFVKTTAFSGVYKEDPYYFNHIGVSYLNLKVASRALPYAQGIRTSYIKTTNYTQGYLTLHKNIREASHGISYEGYKEGHTLYAFDLTPDLCSADHFNLLRDGSLDLDVQLDYSGTDLLTKDKSHTAIFYLEFDNIIEITKDRQVLVDYKL